MAEDELLPGVPIVGASEIVDALFQLDNFGLDPDRPFEGQSHTEEGERGQTLVDLRFRDVADCLAIGFLLACGHSETRAAAATWNDVYDALNTDPDFDPKAVCQNMLCEMERRMGIYPNVPGLTPDPEEDE